MGKNKAIWHLSLFFSIAIVMSCNSTSHIISSCPKFYDYTKNSKSFKNRISWKYHTNKVNTKFPITVTYTNSHNRDSLFKLPKTQPDVNFILPKDLTASLSPVEHSSLNQEFSKRSRYQKHNHKSLSEEKLYKNLPSQSNSHSLSNEKDEDAESSGKSNFTKNLFWAWFLTIISIFLIGLALFAIVIPALSYLLIIIAMFISFKAVKKSWKALFAKGAGLARIFAIPPLIVSAIISLVLLIIVAIASLLT